MDIRDITPSSVHEQSADREAPLSMLHDAMFIAAHELNDTPNIEPSCQTVETLRVPFGQYGDGNLSTRITNEHGYVTGNLQFIAHDPEQRSFTCQRQVGDASWTIVTVGKSNAPKPISVNTLIRQLDLRTPLDSPSIRSRELAMQPQSSDADLLDLLESAVYPQATYIATTKTYTFLDSSLQPDGKVRSDTELDFSIKMLGDLVDKVSVTINSPYYVDGQRTVVCSKVVAEATGFVSIQTSYLIPNTNAYRTIPIENEQGFADATRVLLAKMLIEKQGELGD